MPVSWAFSVDPGGVLNAAKRLSLSAWISLGLHLIAGLAMLLVLRWGLQTNPNLADRMGFVVQERIMWTCGWLTWTLAGASFLVFCACFAKVHDAELGLLGRAALGLAVVAVLLDWSSQFLFVFELPRLAAVDRTASFLLTSRRAVILTGGWANGFYTAATTLLVWGARSSYPRWVTRPGWGVALFGTWLSWAAWTGSTRALFWSNAGLVPCVILWMAGTALTAGRRAG